MTSAQALLSTALVLSCASLAFSQNEGLVFPKTVEAGSAFSVQISGSGPGTLYIVGPGQALKRDVQLGQAVYFSAGSLCNAGHYVAVLGGNASGTTEFDVVAVSKPADLSFLAKPSRLPVSTRVGITGAVYVFDSYHNLIATPLPVQFELTTPSSATQTRSTIARNGAAWAEFDSSPQQGVDRFVASANGASSARVIRQVPGDPCMLKMSASLAGQRLQLTTDPVRDCNGNAVPDGTIVTFTQAYLGEESTVDVPLKRGIAEVQMPAHPGAMISVASGVVLGNQIRWEK
jgi:hypothetical protein